MVERVQHLPVMEHVEEAVVEVVRPCLSAVQKLVEWELDQVTLELLLIMVSVVMAVPRLDPQQTVLALREV